MRGRRLWNMAISSMLLVGTIIALVTMILNGNPEWPIAAGVVVVATYMVIFFARHDRTKQ